MKLEFCHLISLSLRHMSSKGLTEAKLDAGKTFKFYGYRGEALANLRHISALLQIVSRSVNGKPVIFEDF